METLIKFGSGIGNGDSLENACVAVCERELTTTGNDNVRLRIVDPNFNAAIGTLCEIWRDGDTWFRGPISAVSERKDGMPGFDVTVETAWWWLKRIVYMQPYARVGSVEPPEEGSNDPSTVIGLYRYRSQVMLGINSEADGPQILGEEETTEATVVDPGRITTTAQIEQILRYAKEVLSESGHPVFNYTLNLAGRMVPVMAMQDASCYECIMQCLKWHPDALVLTDASGSLRIRGKAGLPTVDLPANCKSRETRRSRADMIVPVVEIQYPRAMTVDDAEIHTEIIRDRWPEDEDAHQPGALGFTINLQGPGITHRKQRVKTIAIPDEGDRDAAARKWIISHFAEFSGLTETQFEDQFIIGLDSFKQVVKRPANLDPEESFPTSFPRELVEGMVPDWMMTPSQKRAAPTVVSVHLKYKGTNAKLRQLFALTGERWFEVSITGTTLSANGSNGRTYMATAGYNAGEDVPTGLAQAFFESLDDNPYQGALALAWQDDGVAAGGSLRAGTKLTNYGLIQRVNEDLGTGLQQLEYGPFAPDLTPVEWVELQRKMTRTIHLSYADPKRRNETKWSDDSAVGGSQYGPQNVTSIGPLRQTGWFTCDRSGADTVFCKGGHVYHTDWGGAGTLETPGKLIQVAESMISGIGPDDRIYLKLTYTKTTELVDLQLDLARKDLTWQGDWSGSAVFSGGWSGSLDLSIGIICTGGGSGSTGGGGSTGGSGSCDCSCSCDCYAVWAGGVTGAIVDPIVTVTGQVTGSISPSYIYESTKAMTEVTYWEPTAAVVEKGNSLPTNTDEEVYILLAIVKPATGGDPADGWTLEQCHTGAIWAAVPWEMRRPGESGGVGP